MSVKVTDDTLQIKADMNGNISLFLRFLIDDVDAKADPFTPRLEGNLRNSPLKSVIGKHGQIEWRKVYAAFQEAGVRSDGTHRVQNYTTPCTGKGYAEKGVKLALKNAPATLKKAGLA